MTLLVVFTAGCVSKQALTDRLVSAAQPAHLPLVVACWEKQIETDGFQSDYTASLDFTVEKKTSRILRARTRSVEPDDAQGRALAACVEEALARTTLPREADAEGPGFVMASDVEVRGYRIAFVGPKAETRERAAERQAHVLLGPRADRCQGLYQYAPPRDAATLSAELSERERKVDATASGDRDQHARELQKTYDTQLELRERLRLDAAHPDVPLPSQKRLLEAMQQVEQDARRTGALIRCEPPLSRR
ncbi:hypothetical protein [Chondromyces crocatus]|nr:hypothetical protein [Chondromyces crocatus]